MNFDKRYDRHEFLRFLESFLPEDFTEKIEEVHIDHKTTYIRQVTRLGRCQSLDLLVYEMRHNSVNDARVGLSKEAFRFLANEWEGRALVLFVPENNDANYRFSLITIDLDMTEEGKTLKRYSNPRRYSYYLGEGIAWYTPNKYLNEAGRVKDEKDLIGRFSVEVLTKAFYQELSDWYAWAVKVVRFPNKLNDPTDDDKFNAESTIRLVTRLIFVWFLKQKHLIPEEFFDKEAIGKLIKGFSPNTVSDLLYQKGESVYYKAILQNLFFAMLNSPITKEGSTELSERHFHKRSEETGQITGYDSSNNKLMCYEPLFNNPQYFVKLANKTVPFLNGGLFDCLDDKVNGVYTDGFSDSVTVQKSLFVPDYLFFIEGHVADLSLWYNDRRKSTVKIDGIINILKRYNFTVEENTPFDQEVSLDPELLGKVFENLLASYNPETQTTARKQTGSFYTPREIVQYMVDESLVAHLKRTVGDELEEQYRQLMRYTDEEVLLTDAQRKQIMQSLYHCKVLDPACGSGAFPMGMLQQMVHILNRIDPDNEMWKEMMLNVAIDETSEAYRTASSDERREMIADIERSFDESVNRPDYARKLYLIENCIYGVDIQPIAIQISKLRFFISLVVDQKANDNPAENFGIRPLPNLEAKFVAANTLIGLDKKDSSLFDTPEILAKKEELKVAKHKIFGAKTVRTKRKYKEAVNRIRQEIAELLRSMGAIGESEATVLASWDMFDQNASSPFFDPEWMFDVKEGFDIVIGNPPYGLFNKKQNKGESIIVAPQVLEVYKTAIEYIPARGGMLNIFRLFIIKSVRLLCKGGVFSEIFPLAYTCDISAAKTREFVFQECRIISLEMFPERDNPKKRVFENAKMSVCILTMLKVKSNDYRFNMRVNRERYIEDYKETSYISLSQIRMIDPIYQSIPLTEKKDTDILIKVYKNSKPLMTYGKCYTGEIDMTICKDAFSKNSSFKKMIRGANIDRFVLKTTMSQGETLFINPIYLQKIKKIDNALYENERIVMQGITGVNEIKRLKMTLSDHAYCANSVNYCLFTEVKINAKYALALLNSKLLNYIFKLQSTNSNVNGYEVDNLPIIISTNQTKYIDLVNSILLAKQQTFDADTSRQEQIIDIMVYHLYGLTYDEVLIVDPQTPITREEYEKE